MAAPTSTLHGWASAPFSASGHTYDVLRRGQGPGVLVIPEVPGVSPEVLGFAQHLVNEGFTVAIASLFGTPGRPVSAGYALSTIAKLCVASEMRAFAVGAERPVSLWLRALARDLAAVTPGRGVGVVGMCFTGGFALATAVDPSVGAAVMSQPSVPLPLGAARRRDLGLSPAETSALQARTAQGLCLLGLRFTRDRAVPGERFQGLRQAFGDAFEAVELPSGPGTPYASSAHSVTTGEVRTDPPNSAHAAREQTVTFLRRQLQPAG